MRTQGDVAAHNLTVWQNAASENRELRLLQAEALGEYRANTLAGEDANADMLFVPSPELSSSALVPPADFFAHALSLEEQLAFCRGFLRVRPLPFGEEPPKLSPAPASARVAFSDSAFSRAALRVFSSVLPHARPLVAPSFTAVCEELASDRADFALLPLEDSHEGKLFGLLDEIDRFEFHITHTTDVPYPDGGRSVTIALLTKRFAPSEAKGERLLCCSVLEEDENTLLDILMAARCCGLSLRRIDSRPAPYGEDGVIYLPTFRAENGEVTLFTAFLSVRHPRARITARYTHLK